MVPSQTGRRAARRARAQPEERRRAIPAAAPGVRHRRVGLGQVHADAGRAVPGAAQGTWASRREAPGAFDAPARRRAGRRRGVRRPVPDRPHHALEPGELRRRLRRDPRAVRRASRRAQERGYTAGTFSFNSGNGRCPTCGGNGFEHVEMQFLSDVYLRCPDCDGKRYRDEVLEVKREGADGTRANIADVLDLTVTEALAFFADATRSRARLQPLVDVGLDYVKLGQPVPTLSGGEAQRLKLAGHLAEAARRIDTPSIRGKLFLFDEPTTGLHFDDVAKLLRAFRKLLAAGHSLLVIEHNLDVIRAADWLIDLGPRRRRRAAARSSRAGTPERGASANARSHTGKALRGVRAGAGVERPWRAARLPQRACADAGARACPRNRRATQFRRRSQRARAQPQEHRRRDSARRVHRDHRRLGLGQVDARLRHPVQRRPAPLPRIAERLRAPVRAAGGAARRRRDLRHSADGGDRAAHQPRRPQEHGRHAHRDLPLPAPALREARHAVLPGLRRADRAAERRTHRRAPAAATTAASASGCSRRWWSPARAIYTDLAKWAAGKGYTHLRVDGEFLPTDAVAAPRPLQGAHHRAAGGADRRADATTTTRCSASARSSALELGKGVVHVLDPEAKRPKVHGVLDQARLPVLRHAASPSSTRACSRSTPSTAGARAASAPASSSTGFDEEQTRRGNLRGTTGSRASRTPARPATASA